MKGSAYPQDLQDCVIDVVETEGLGGPHPVSRSASSMVKWVQRDHKLGEGRRCNGGRLEDTARTEHKARARAWGGWLPAYRVRVSSGFSNLWRSG